MRIKEAVFRSENEVVRFMPPIAFPQLQGALYPMGNSHRNCTSYMILDLITLLMFAYKYDNSIHYRRIVDIFNLHRLLFWGMDKGGQGIDIAVDKIMLGKQRLHLWILSFAQSINLFRISKTTLVQ